MAQVPWEQYPCSILVRHVRFPRDLLATSWWHLPRGCYEETAAVEFKLIRYDRVSVRHKSVFCIESVERFELILATDVLLSAYPTLRCISRNRDTPVWNFVPNSGLNKTFVTARRQSRVRAVEIGQRWLLVYHLQTSIFVYKTMGATQRDAQVRLRQLILVTSAVANASALEIYLLIYVICGLQSKRAEAVWCLSAVVSGAWAVCMFVGRFFYNRDPFSTRDYRLSNCELRRRPLCALLTLNHSCIFNSRGARARRPDSADAKITVV